MLSDIVRGCQILSDAIGCCCRLSEAVGGCWRLLVAVAPAVASQGISRRLAGG